MYADLGDKSTLRWARMPARWVARLSAAATGKASPSTPISLASSMPRPSSATKTPA